MSGAQEYYDGLLTQGYTPDQAKMYTQQHFPGFEPAAPQVAPMDQFQVNQTQVQDVAQQHGVDPTQLAETARHFDANQDGILQQSELQATAQQMVSTTAPVAPAAAAPPAAAPMAAAPMAAAPPGMAAPMGGMPAPGMAAPMGGMPAPGMAAPMGGMMPMPAASGGGSPLGYVAVACIVLTLVFSTWGVLGGTWLVADDDDADAYTDLTHGYYSQDVSSLTDGMYDDCQEFLDDAKDQGADDLEDATCDGKNIVMAVSYSEICDDGEDEEACEVASAGLWGTIILWVAVAAGLGATLLIIFNTFGIDALPVNTQQFGMITGIAAGALAGIGVLVWYILLPSDTDGMNAGLNVWLTIVGAVTGIAGGILTKTHGNPSA